MCQLDSRRHPTCKHARQQITPCTASSDGSPGSSSPSGLVPNHLYTCNYEEAKAPLCFNCLVKGAGRMREEEKKADETDVRQEQAGSGQRKDDGELAWIEGKVVRVREAKSDRGGKKAGMWQKDVGGGGDWVEIHQDLEKKAIVWPGELESSAPELELPAQELEAKEVLLLD